MANTIIGLKTFTCFISNAGSHDGVNDGDGDYDDGDDNDDVVADEGSGGGGGGGGGGCRLAL